jgi:hypothetical protein
MFVSNRPQRKVQQIIPDISHASGQLRLSPTKLTVSKMISLSSLFDFVHGHSQLVTSGDGKREYYIPADHKDTSEIIYAATDRKRAGKTPRDLFHEAMSHGDLKVRRRLIVQS